jgi:thiosulfate dehydrogenase
VRHRCGFVLLGVLAACTAGSRGPDPALVARGEALFVRTVDSLPANARSVLTCSSCHRNGGRDTTALPLYGVSLRYPRFIARAGRVASIEDRVNFCFTRSLAGRRLRDTSQAMRAMVAYLASLTPGAAVVDTVAVSIAGDSARGAGLFVAQCVRCHGVDGSGTVVAPPLWGARSYNIGAGMARVTRAATFIRHAMPADRPGSLSVQDAADLAAFVDRHARPDYPEKDRDWPDGDAPRDAPYSTARHASLHPVPVLPPP